VSLHIGRALNRRADLGPSSGRHHYFSGFVLDASHLSL
jgi:hypothetical protein